MSAAIPGFNILFWILLWGAAMRIYEIKFAASDNVLGSVARALSVVY
jgi:hypothetical protein